MGKSTDATRAERKAKKRALAATIPDLPGDDGAAPEVEVKTVKKSKKRKHEEVESTVEELIANGDMESKNAMKRKKGDTKKRKSDVDELDVQVEVEEKPAKTSKRDKKGKSSREANGDVLSGEVVDNSTIGEKTLKKSKKERKAERKAKEAAEVASAAAKPDSTEPAETTPQANGDTSVGSEEKKVRKNNRNREKTRKVQATNGDTAKVEDKSARFICFIGNPSAPD